MLKIIKNPDEVTYKEVLQDVNDCGGYCPCIQQRTKDTMCMCKEFREKNTEGFCRCGLYMKIKVSD